MQRIEWMNAMLASWAVWRLTGSTKIGGYSCPAYNPQRVAQTDDVRAGMARSFTPTEDSDALSTDRAVAALPGELKKTVILAYTYDGGIEQVSLRLKITRATLHRRLCQADIRLVELIKMQNEKNIQNS